MVKLPLFNLNLERFQPLLQGVVVQVHMKWGGRLRNGRNAGDPANIFRLKIDNIERQRQGPTEVLVFKSCVTVQIKA